MKKWQIIELGDGVHQGIGFFSYNFDYAVKALLGVFYNTEQRHLCIEIFWFRITIKLGFE